jgi:hypothetical protein
MSDLDRELLELQASLRADREQSARSRADWEDGNRQWDRGCDAAWAALNKLAEECAARLNSKRIATTTIRIFRPDPDASSVDWVEAPGVRGWVLRPEYDRNDSLCLSKNGQLFIAPYPRGRALNSSLARAESWNFTLPQPNRQDGGGMSPVGLDYDTATKEISLDEWDGGYKTTVSLPLRVKQGTARLLLDG